MFTHWRCTWYKTQQKSKMFWGFGTADGISSTVEFLQLFSDNCITTLSAGALRFYSLHFTLLNFSYYFCKALISSDRTAIAYLPVSFETDGRQVRSANSISYRKWRKARTIMVEGLHEGIDICLRALKEADVKGFQIATKGNRKLHMHHLLSSNVADIFEAESLLGVKRVNKTFYPCHMCYTSWKLFSGCTSSHERNSMVTIKLILSLDVSHQARRKIRRSKNTRCFRFHQFWGHSYLQEFNLSLRCTQYFKWSHCTSSLLALAKCSKRVPHK